MCTKFIGPGMVKSIVGSYKFVYHPEGIEGDSWEIDFTPPFRRLDMFKDLERVLGISLPSADKLDTEGKVDS